MTYSEPISEIIGRQPKWIIRSGISLVALIFISLFILSFYISYPYLIYSPVQITSKTPPLKVIVKSNSIINKLLVVDGQEVSKGMALVLFDSKTNYEKLLKLEKIIHDKEDFKEIKTFLNANISYLGEQQLEIENLLLAIHNRLIFIENDNLSLEVNFLPR